MRAILISTLSSSTRLTHVISPFARIDNRLPKFSFVLTLVPTKDRVDENEVKEIWRTDI